MSQTLEQKVEALEKKSRTTSKSAKRSTFNSGLFQ